MNNCSKLSCDHVILILHSYSYTCHQAKVSSSAGTLLGFPALVAALNEYALRRSFSPVVGLTFWGSKKNVNVLVSLLLLIAFCTRADRFGVRYDESFTHASEIAQLTLPYVDCALRVLITFGETGLHRRFESSALVLSSV